MGCIKDSLYFTLFLCHACSKKKKSQGRERNRHGKYFKIYIIGKKEVPESRSQKDHNTIFK
jgi:hypothetical protein